MAYKVPDSAIQGRSRRPATGCSPLDSKRWATCRPVSLESSDHPDLNGGDPEETSVSNPIPLMGMLKIARKLGIGSSVAQRVLAAD
jgi:hypothetical protein